jgi:hypothetical protein
MSRRQIIWITIFALMLLGNQYDRLDLGGFFLLVFIGMGLVRIFDKDKAAEPNVPPYDEVKAEMDNDLSPEDIIQVKRRTIELLRNSLMRHHNSRGADKDYQVSAASKETTEILQVLNVALTKKPKRLAAHTHS